MPNFIWIRNRGQDPLYSLQFPPYCPICNFIEKRRFGKPSLRSAHGRIIQGIVKTVTVKSTNRMNAQCTYLMNREMLGCNNDSKIHFRSSTLIMSRHSNDPPIRIISSLLKICGVHVFHHPSFIPATGSQGMLD